MIDPWVLECALHLLLGHFDSTLYPTSLPTHCFADLGLVSLHFALFVWAANLGFEHLIASKAVVRSPSSVVVCLHPVTPSPQCADLVRFAGRERETRCFCRGLLELNWLCLQPPGQ